MDIIKDLWENEADLCSYICNIRQEQLTGSSKSTSYSMFFLEALLVPPTKFRPAAVAGDSVSMILAKVAGYSGALSVVILYDTFWDY